MFLNSAEAWWLLGICAVLVVIFLLVAHFTQLKTKTPRFYSWIGAIAIFGGALAFLLPIALNSGFGKDDDGRVLRQLILYTTGGLLGVITLGETHRKNNQEKEKNENDHTRQVHAERRSRYTTAVEQLANEKAAVRLGGIYTLVGLVDEWLADDAIMPEEQQKEGQIIINNLCSYIRSPFHLVPNINILQADNAPADYAGNFITDQAMLREEQDIRRAIFDEMDKRSSTFQKDKNGTVSTIPGAWSSFDFNFNRAPIFYPLNNLTIEKANFSSANFYDAVVFSQTTFAQQANFRKANFIQNATFREANFLQNATFREANFLQNANFREANFLENATFNEAMIHKASFYETVFTQNASFSEVTFTSNAYFSKAAFTQKAYFSKSNFIQNADFSEATFAQNATFNEATFNQHANFSKATFNQHANFDGVTFAQKGTFYTANFTRNANFNRATFAQNANFSKAVFTQNADFSEAIFTQSANFSEAAFTHNAYFHKAIFTQDAFFSQANFKQKVYFHEVTFIQDAHFSRVVFVQDATFSKAMFTRNAAFRETTFVQNANFSEATFTQNANFSRVTFSASSPKFVETSEVLGRTFRARFATLPKNQRAYSFTVSEGSFPILLGEAELGDGVKHHIPVGAVLFDPDSWDEEKQKYTRVSEPAKPLDKSNDGEEEKPE
ncbi:pentapeptide repeat-containing protein [Rothia mucilaginosa]|uniref:pentapeptide repeat-containing protein n=1 Tax=Rothia mucilaginosa TaxID=43675 RepID=UPI0026F06670|nr:pentapeptide repeat-containing protein [Rothia mucilaginosa]